MLSLSRCRTRFIVQTIGPNKSMFFTLDKAANKVVKSCYSVELQSNALV